MVVLIRPVLVALFAAKKADAALSNPLLMAHQQAMGSLFLTGLLLFLARNAQVAAQRAKSATFAVALAIEPVSCHAAVFLVAKCNQVLAAKSLPNFQRQGRCLMRLWMTYIHLSSP